MINIRYGKNISFVWVITLNGQEVDLTGHTVQVELTLPNNNKVIIKPTVDYNILTFDYQGHNVGRHFLTCYLDRNTPNELMCDDKYGFNLVAQSWMEDDSLAGDVQTESINLSWNISNDAATKGWVKAQQYLNARDLEDYDFASRTELNEGLDTKQDKLTAGANITISGNTISAKDTTYTAGENVHINGTVISATDTNTTYSAGTGLALNGTTFSVNNTIATKNDLNAKQDKLTAGSNIQINGNTISATDTKYTAGTNVQINNKVISATDTKYTAGTGLALNGTTFSVNNTIATKNDLNAKQDKLTAGSNIQINGNTISATDTTYTAGENITIENNVISSTGDTTYTASAPLNIDANDNISIDLSDYATKNDLNDKQDTLTAGANITIDNNTISATDTTYSAGNGLSLSGTEFAVDTTVVATQTDLSGKQDTLTAGSNISINNDTISATDTTYSAGTGLDLTGTEFSVDTTTIATKTDLNSKQDTLTAGSNITITNNTISATDTTYTAGDGLDFANNEFSVNSTIARVTDLASKQDVLTPGNNITISENDVISATDTTYTAGNGLDLTGTQFSVDTTVVATQNDLSGKQDTLTAGSNITITNDTISATDTTYSAGTGLSLNNNEFSADTTVLATQTDLSGKQNTLTAGSNITISNDTISATNTTYTAGTGIEIDANNVISSTGGEHDYSKDYLTFVALEDGTFGWTTNSAETFASLYYSVDNGTTWTELAPNTQTPTVTTGNKILWKSNGGGASYKNRTFTSTGEFNAEGNIMSIQYETNFDTQVKNIRYALFKLFNNCTKLISAENLIMPSSIPASDYCTDMFAKCSGMIKAPKLPATSLATYCYYSMFYGCTSLTTAPELPALSLPDNAYRDMFDNCSSLNYIKMNATNIGSATYVWLSGVSATGTFVKNINATWTDTGVSGVPTGWTVKYENTGYTDKTPTDGSMNAITSDAVYDALGTKQDTLTAGTGIAIDANNVISATGGGDVPYEEQYLTFEALEDGTFSFTRTGTTADVSYSVDNGTTWTVLASGTQTPTVTTGNKILWKSDRTSDTFSSSNYITFSATGNFDVMGNIMSMAYSDTFVGQTTLSGKTNVLYRLFNNCTTIKNATNLILPATTLGTSCYKEMFKGCTALATAPELPATTLASDCYYGMFEGCTALATAPELPATTLTDNCYMLMFKNCTSLAKVPELPATVLTIQCYNAMFKGCTSLTTAPELHATTLAAGCYPNIFNGCTSLNYIKMLATDISATSCLTGWVTDVAASGIFVKNPLATWDNTNVVPSGWTVEYEDTGYIDKEPINGSINAITSDAVYDGLAAKQDTLTAGSNITISSNTISATDTTYSAGNGLSLSGTEFAVDTTVVATQTDLSGKQNTLTAGSNITITNDTISATDTTYSAGTGISIDANNEISATVTFNYDSNTGILYITSA